MPPSFKAVFKSADDVAGAAKNVKKAASGAGNAKTVSKSVKQDVPVKKVTKNDGIEPKTTKPKETGVEAPPNSAKNLAQNVAVVGGIAGLTTLGATFLPGMLQSGTQLAGTKILADTAVEGLKAIGETAQEMFSDLLDSPGGLLAVVAAVGVVAVVSMRR